MRKLKVLVSGGRQFDDVDYVWYCLDTIEKEALRPNGLCIGELIHGGAAGVDTISGSWAKAKDIPVKVYNAEWKKWGANAGAIRNSKMITEEEPDAFVIFPGGRGTNDMRMKAKHYFERSKKSVAIFLPEGVGCRIKEERIH